MSEKKRAASPACQPYRETAYKETNKYHTSNPLFGQTLIHPSHGDVLQYWVHLWDENMHNYILSPLDCSACEHCRRFEI
jgi:hypothetical protein